MQLSWDPAGIANRYQSLSAQVKGENGWRVLRTGMATTPEDPAFPRAEIFMGSHVDEDPTTEDRVEAWSFRPDPSGGEQILQEIFVERHERTRFLGPKHQVLYRYAMLIRSPGGSVLDGALSVVDLETGKLLNEQKGDEALDRIHRLGLAHDSGQHNPPAHAYRPRTPEPPPPPPGPSAREQVDTLRTGLDHDGAAAIREEADQVQVGEVVLDRRRA